VARRYLVLAAAAWAAAGALQIMPAGGVSAAGQAAVASVLDGAYTDAQAMRGEPVYLDSCANCHGVALEGGDMTPGLTGAVFGANWNDLTLGDLFERIRTSMPLDRPGKLTRQQNADVIAFILKANQWPAGAREVPTDLASLSQVKVQSVR
jgi:mono/diheme cytochrome c family protein